MEIINFDQFLDKREYINKNDFAPTWPARILCIGPSGCGKSNMVYNLILKYLHFNKFFLYAKDVEEDKYIYLKEFFGDLEEKVTKELKKDNPKQKIDDVKIAHFFSDLNDMIDINDFDGSEQVLVVIDDFIMEKDQEKIKQLFIRGRKRNISTIYIAHDFFKIPKIIRLNANYVILFDVNNKREISAIASTYAHRVTYNLFRKLYRDIMKKPYAFMVIDTTVDINNITKHIRNGFDGLYCEDVFQE
jgi:hypothetical protein